MIAAWPSYADWANHVSVIGFPLAVVGFGATLFQLKRTRRSAEAAATAASGAQAQFANNHLLVLLPQLQRIENDLTSAARGRNVDLLLHHLDAWRWEAGQLSSLLVQADRGAKVLPLLQESVTLASVAKKRLLTDRADLLGSTEQVRDSVSEVTDAFGGLVADLTATLTQDPGDRHA